MLKDERGLAAESLRDLIGLASERQLSATEATAGLRQVDELERGRGDPFARLLEGLTDERFARVLDIADREVRVREADIAVRQRQLELYDERTRAIREHVLPRVAALVAAVGTAALAAVAAWFQAYAE